MYYVTMIDKVLSGWRCNDGKINKLVIECETLDEAEIVESNARNRTDMKNISISYKKPYYSPKKYIVHYHSKKDYSKWFEANSF